MRAQSNNIVTGVVTSAQNEPLIGVTVMVENTTNGTVTDFDGNFSIAASPSDKLVFSYIGYVSQTIEVGDQTHIRVQMAEENEMLDELVVIGYGSVKKSDLTGAISSVKSDQLENTASAGIESALQGKVPGVLITKNSGQPGGETDIKIRGVGSFNSSGPLWVIDGVPQTPGTKFNMNDAESVEITASKPLLYASEPIVSLQSASFLQPGFPKRELKIIMYHKDLFRGHMIEGSSL